MQVDHTTETCAEICRMCTIFKLMYLADDTKVNSRGSCESLDMEVRRVVMEWLYLPPTRADAILYSRFIEGGLDSSN